MGLPDWGPFAHERLEDRALQPQAVQGQSRPRRLTPHPDIPGIVIKHTCDGPDYIRVCELHQWASPPMPTVTSCPFCLAVVDEADGRTRFDQIQMALALEL